MASTFNLSNTAANAAVNGGSLAPLFNSGYLNIYSGTQPANANTALTTQTLLASLRFGATAFGAAVAGVITANAITGANAGATGTASFFRCIQSDDTTVICDGSIGTSGADLNLSTTAIVSGTPVQATSITITLPEA